MSGEWAATETGRTIARLAPSAFAISAAASIAARSPDTTTWPGELRFATAKTPCAEASLDELRDRRVVEPEDGGHRAVPAGAARLHLERRAHGRAGRRPASVSAPAATIAEYWPIEWPAMKRGAGSAIPAAAARSRAATR